jgi:hypothetical protein
VQSSLGSTFQVTFCDNPTRSLQGRVFTTLDFVARAAAGVRTLIEAAGVNVVSCADPGVSLYRAAAPINVVSSYIDSGLKDKNTFRSAWRVE